MSSYEQQQQQQRYLPNSRWQITKTCFRFVFVSCAILVHFWALAHGLKIKKACNWLFVTKCLMQAVLMDTLIAHGKRISAMIDSFEEIVNDQGRAILAGRRTKVMLITVIIAVVSYIAFGVSEIWTCYDRVVDHLISVLCFGYGDNLPVGTKTFILSIDSFMYHLTATLLVVWLPLVYGFLVKIILNQVTSLKDKITERKSNSSFEQVVQETGKSLGKIRKLVNELNQCLGSAVLVWSGSALTAICQGVAYSRGLILFHDPWGTVSAYVLCLSPTFILVVLSTSVCSKVTSELKDAAELLHDLSDVAEREGLVSQLHLLLYKMSVPELTMSGGGCFAINNQFCLSYICLVMSYATFVLQLPP